MMNFWRQRAEEFVEESVVKEWPKKVFKAKHKLPAGSDGTADLGVMFWANFPINTSLAGVSLISAAKVESLAREWGE